MELQVEGLRLTARAEIRLQDLGGLCLTFLSPLPRKKVKETLYLAFPDCHKNLNFTRPKSKIFSWYILKLLFDNTRHSLRELKINQELT